MVVVARIGVGYDAVDVPALTAHEDPADDGRHRQFAIASPSRLFHDDGAGQARRRLHGRWSRTSRWGKPLRGPMPVDLFGKTVLVVGFGRIGTRSPSAARRWR